MAPHSSTLAWRIPWMEEPGGLQSMGLHRVRHDWSDLAAAANIYPILSLYLSLSWAGFRMSLHFLSSQIQTVLGFYIVGATRAFVVVESFSHGWLSETPWTAARQASLSFTLSWSLLRLMPVESEMPSNHLSSSVTPFSSCPQPFPASGSFPVSRLFASGGQSLGASDSVLPMNIQGYFL